MVRTIKQMPVCFKENILLIIIHQFEGMGSAHSPILGRQNPENTKLAKFLWLHAFPASF